MYHHTAEGVNLQQHHAWLPYFVNGNRLFSMAAGLIAEELPNFRLGVKYFEK